MHNNNNNTIQSQFLRLWGKVITRQLKVEITKHRHNTTTMIINSKVKWLLAQK